MVSIEPHRLPNSLTRGDALSDGKNLTCGSVCPNRKEKNRFGALSAGLGLTIGICGAAMSFLPEDWLDRLAQAPVWLGCVASLILWAILTEAMYSIFGANRK